MAGAASNERECLLPICSRSGSLQRFKLRRVVRLIECATERHDDATRNRIQAMLDAEGEQASVQIHKLCYCSYTSKHHVTKLTAKKQTDDPTGDDVDPPPAARQRRSQVQQFDFREQCLFCAAVCKPVDPKHPNRWDRVVQCEVRGVPDAPPFKDAVLCHCANHNDEWSSEVAVRISGVHDLAAAPAPPQLSDVINCQCKSEGKKCRTEACDCHREHLSCTNYCNCRGHDGCCNPHTTQGVMQAVDDDNAEIDDAGEEIVDRD